MILEYRSIILWLPGKSVPKNAARLDVAFAPLLDSGLKVEPGLFALCRRDTTQRLERHSFRVGLAAELE